MRQGCFSRDHVTQDLGSRSTMDFILKATGKRPASPKQEHDKIRLLIKEKLSREGDNGLEGGGDGGRETS